LNQPDCAGYQQTAARHAQQLSAAGERHAIGAVLYGLGFRVCENPKPQTPNPERRTPSCAALCSLRSVPEAPSAPGPCIGRGAVTAGDFRVWVFCGSGIDFAVVDMTNLPQYDNSADAIQLRPFEVRDRRRAC
jgi:hypothetical protein